MHRSVRLEHRLAILRREPSRQLERQIISTSTGFRKQLEVPVRRRQNMLSPRKWRVERRRWSRTDWSKPVRNPRLYCTEQARRCNDGRSNKPNQERLPATQLSPISPPTVAGFERQFLFLSLIRVCCRSGRCGCRSRVLSQFSVDQSL